MDYDLDSAMFPLLTVQLTVVFTGILMVHLWNSPHVVPSLCHQVLVGDFGWKLYALLPENTKTSLCEEMSKRGPVVYASKNSRSFIRGKCDS